MPVNTDRTNKLAAAVAGIYREAETALLVTTRNRLNAGLDRTTWQQDQLASIGVFRRAATRIVTELESTGNNAIRKAIAAAYRAGNADAVADLVAALSPSTPRPPTISGVAARIGHLAVQSLADATIGELRPVYAQILPNAEHVYRDAIAGAAARRHAGIASTREAAQAAWARLVSEGITGYTDSRGRRWRLHTYVEMATRAAVTRSAVHGQTDAFRASGVRLVSVDDVPAECIRCRPFEHRILALWGSSGRQQVPSASDPQVLVDVDVLATLDEAMSQGLFHPNCRHHLREYLPGTSMLIKQGRTADPEGEAARERQRAIERLIRFWREREIAALTPAARTSARAVVTTWEHEIAAHVKQHGLTRLRYREQIGAGHIPPASRLDDLARVLSIPQHTTHI